MTTNSHSNRLLYNRAIVNKLSELVEKHPDLRFCQLLVGVDIIKLKENSDGNTEIIDNFNEESEVTWNKMISNKLCFPN